MKKNKQTKITQPWMWP